MNAARWVSSRTSGINPPHVRLAFQAVNRSRYAPVLSRAAQRARPTTRGSSATGGFCRARATTWGAEGALPAFRNRSTTCEAHHCAPFLTTIAESSGAAAGAAYISGNASDGYEVDVFVRAQMRGRSSFSPADKRFMKRKGGWMSQRDH